MKWKWSELVITKVLIHWTNNGNDSSLELELEHLHRPLKNGICEWAMSIKSKSNFEQLLSIKINAHVFEPQFSPPQEHNNFIIILKYLLLFNHIDWPKWWHLIVLYFIIFFLFSSWEKHWSLSFRCQRSCPIFVEGIFSKCRWWYS